MQPGPRLPARGNAGAAAMRCCTARIDGGRRAHRAAHCCLRRGSAQPRCCSTCTRPARWLWRNRNAVPRCTAGAAAVGVALGAAAGARRDSRQIRHWVSDDHPSGHQPARTTTNCARTGTAVMWRDQRRHAPRSPPRRRRGLRRHGRGQAEPLGGIAAQQGPASDHRPSAQRLTSRSSRQGRRGARRRQLVDQLARIGWPAPAADRRAGAAAPAGGPTAHSSGQIRRWLIPPARPGAGFVGHALLAEPPRPRARAAARHPTAWSGTCRSHLR